MSHYRHGDYAPAQSLCRAILARDQEHVQSLILLGDMAQQAGRNKLAVKLLGQALALDAGNTAAHDTIAMAYQALGRRDVAVEHFRQAIAFGLGDAELLVKQSVAVAAPLRRLAQSWPRRLSLVELLGTDGAAALGREAMLLALLQSKLICDVELERLFAALRRAVLQHASAGDGGEVSGEALALFCALAQQCYTNEYVYAFDDGERAQVEAVRARLVAALQGGGAVAPLDLVAVASYLPLCSLPQAAALLDADWSEPVARVLTQQIGEPRAEAADRSAIPVLTAIDDESRALQRQYEENPYPRWLTLPPVKPTRLCDYLRDTLHVAALPEETADRALEILVAGCGTGSHSIDTARRFSRARLLAVDLSLSSLAYARRKSRELRVDNIDYAQADILKLGALPRRFDVIEAVGVLHHLADPAQGWRILLSLLRPNGLMFVGLYSALARRSVTAARAFIAEQGYGATAEEIRACRQELMLRGRVPPFSDFASVSGCRDLLFNVTEHQFTIAQIKAFLAANRLTFLGFEQLPADVMPQFRRQFPHEAAIRDLDCWDAFERAHPLSFAHMYLFWVQQQGPH